jgi:hypothetical protein
MQMSIWAVEQAIPPRKKSGVELDPSLRWLRCSNPQPRTGPRFGPNLAPSPVLGIWAGGPIVLENASWVRASNESWLVPAIYNGLLLLVFIFKAIRKVKSEEQQIQ